MRKIRIGMELRSLNNLIRRYFEFSSHKKEIETVTGNNGWIIGFLSENEGREIYQKDLEDRFTITRSTASKVLSLMERKNLIQRQAVTQDARLKKIVLTEKARKIAGLMCKDAERMERTLLRGFTQEETKMLYSYLERMKKNISNTRKDR
ncbi:MarR family transcriptional regulator [Caproiciproducens sp. NJN-50]|uniref:MarR family winged helix-turn-helix transcriptional regulator n=1 Tax=Acutalibacteraceae TaxID=3082771 RepID=UPI000FFE0C76|nr:MULTISPECIES: MarR family transcriptional regulator [Acutalibacteraceae]QAT48659.1 MarR family transcriptional regulator [Caproiciproducens sp. NJN-50]